VDSYLRDSSGVALLAAGVLGASIYVCAVAHIPMVASLLATGAAPGISIVFLVTGTATNLPELIALYNTIGKRTVILYACSLIIGAMIAGAVINAWLMPGFEPVFDPIRSLDMIDVGESLQPTVGNVLTLSSTAAIVILAGVGTWRKITARFSKRNTGSGDSCCSG
jgi:glycerol uptake facilitator-like aquaporin